MKKVELMPTEQILPDFIDITLKRPRPFLDDEIAFALAFEIHCPATVSEKLDGDHISDGRAAMSIAAKTAPEDPIWARSPLGGVLGQGY